MSDSKFEKLPTVAGVVLLVEQHTSFFSGQLIPNLLVFTKPFDELIIVASGLSKRSGSAVRKSVKLLPKDWNVDCHGVFGQWALLKWG